MSNTPVSIWMVRLSSFRGGGHTYATLEKVGATERIEVTRALTDAQAAALRKVDSWDGWQAGMEVERFDSDAEAMDAAVALFRRVGQPGDRLWCPSLTPGGSDSGVDWSGE